MEVKSQKVYFLKAKLIYYIFIPISFPIFFLIKRNDEYGNEGNNQVEAKYKVDKGKGSKK